MKNFSLNREELLPISMVPEKAEDDIEFENDQENEKERQEINIETVADFIKALELSYDIAPDKETQQAIGHQIVKINMGLNATDYSAEDVKVEETTDGVLGLYYPNSNKTAISAELLEDFSSASSLIIHVLSHEEKHKEGVADEGMVELALKKKLPTNLVFYLSEQQMAERAFYNVGTGKALNLYDMDNPAELADCYLSVELEKEYKNSKTEMKKLARESYLNKKVNDEADSLSHRLKEGVPRFYERLSQGYIRDKVRDILKKIVEKNKVVN